MIIEGDCLEVMKTFPDNHFSAICTDPPYGLSFMGKEWDAGVPHAEIWTEALRVSKPGAFLLAFGGTRTYHRLTCAIEDAGWEIRDCLSWLYASGFPKSHNNFGIPGYGTALKPAWEPIIFAMRPLDGTFAKNAEKWGQAGINIDGCRIPIDSEKDDPRLGGKGSWDTSSAGQNVYEGGYAGNRMTSSPKGRWPANVMFDEEAAEMLDEKSGISNPKQQREGVKGGSGFGYFDDVKTSSMNGVWPGDNGGGASRFFYCAKTSSRERNEGLEAFPLKEKKTLNDYTSPSEGRSASKSGAPMANNHPTVKPLKLMTYLIKLIMPQKDGILLDPFAGSGSTLVAATRLGIDCIGIEKQPEYCEIARKRVEHELEKPKQIDLFNEN